MNPAEHSHVILVNRFYRPDEPATALMLTDLAEGLAARGHGVKIIASRARSAHASREERLDGVDVLRLRSTHWGARLGIAGKAVDYLTFTAAARRALRTQLRPGMWLVAMTDPPALAPIAAAAARRANARLVHWIQDIHPEISLALSGSRAQAMLASPFVRCRDAAWRHAELCVAISRDMASLISSHGVAQGRIRVIPNWAPGGVRLSPPPPDQNPLRAEWGFADKFVIAYSGNLGRVHVLDPIIAAANLLKTESDIVFLFVGDGPQRTFLEKRAASLRLPNVRFLPAQPRDRLAESLCAGDVHLVTLRPGCENLVYPSKLYGILTVGRPVVYVGPGRCGLADEIRTSGAGVVIDPGSPQALASSLRELKDNPGRREAMGAAALRWSGQLGGLQAALDAWEEILASG